MILKTGKMFYFCFYIDNKNVGKEQHTVFEAGIPYIRHDASTKYEIQIYMKGKITNIQNT